MDAVAQAAPRQLRACSSLADGTDTEEVKQLLRPTPLSVSVWPLNLEAGRDWWRTTFHQHHYLKGDLQPGARAVLVRETETQTPIAFHSSRWRIMCGGFNGGISYLEHRLVVLPEYQGWGLGPALSEKMGQLLLSAGRRFFATTSHPRLRDSRQKRKDRWKETAASGCLAKPSNWRDNPRRCWRRARWRRAPPRAAGVAGTGCRACPAGRPGARAAARPRPPGRRRGPGRPASTEEASAGASGGSSSWEGAAATTTSRRTSGAGAPPPWRRRRLPRWRASTWPPRRPTRRRSPRRRRRGPWTRRRGNRAAANAPVGLGPRTSCRRGRRHEFHSGCGKHAKRRRASSW
ncbi:unnamed protein product [Prorocentrum cordatum]|uniref:N-acetyltransferase domain-containing protein n=1 Tax=Prorocentrum cordatum TaxID=2364126 RepID=A0ABN9VPV8_9DINO|nr:unnamed protein product [Polarella glacialis]